MRRDREINTQTENNCKFNPLDSAGFSFLLLSFYLISLRIGLIERPEKYVSSLSPEFQTASSAIFESSMSLMEEEVQRYALIGA